MSGIWGNLQLPHKEDCSDELMPSEALQSISWVKKLALINSSTIQCLQAVTNLAFMSSVSIFRDFLRMQDSFPNTDHCYFSPSCCENRWDTYKTWPRVNVLSILFHSWESRLKAIQLKCNRLCSLVPNSEIFLPHKCLYYLLQKSVCSGNICVAVNIFKMTKRYTL